MSSIATTRAVPRNPVNPVHVLHDKLATARAADEAAVVFVIAAERSEKQSLVSSIRSQGWQAQMATSIHELLRQPSTVVPSCLIFHVSDDCNLLDAKRVTAERPEIPIILITSFGDVRMAVEAMKAGAIDFFLKPFSREALLNAIRESLERSRIALDHEIEMRGLRNCYASLSRRERQVMTLVVAGFLNKQVGGELGISEITVKAHRRRVMQKMCANSLPQLVRMAAELAPHRNAIHLA